MAETTANLHSLVLDCAKHAIRPLRLSELADAVSSAGVLEDGAAPDTAKEAIRAVCTYPLQLSPVETIELIGPPPDAVDTDSEARAHLQLAHLCAAHVASNDFSGWESSDPFIFAFPESLTQPNEPSRPFATYAIDNCTVHAGEAISSLPNTDLVKLYAELDKALAVPNAVVALFSTFQTKRSLSRSAARVEGPGPPRETRNVEIKEDSSSTDYLRDGVQKPIDLAVCLGFLDYSRWILETQKPDLPRGLFAHVCAIGDADMTRLLLAHGADLEDRDKTGYGPLHHAIKGNHDHTFAVLMDAGGDLLAKSTPSQRLMDQDFQPLTPLGIAGNANRAMVKHLLRYLQNAKHLTRLLINAVKEGNVEGAMAMLEDPRIDINAHNDPDHQSRTPLYHACASRDHEMIACLLKAGASVQPPNGVSTWDEGKVACWPVAVPLIYIPPLHAYANSGDLILHPWSEVTFHSRRNGLKPFNQDSLDLLLEHGASVGQRDSRQNTALHHAADPDVVHYLIRAGIDYNALNDQGRNFFCAPTDTRHTLEMDLKPVVAGLDLIGGQVDFTPRNRETGQTPMLSWLACGQFHIALRMLELGAYATLADADGNGAFHLALKCPRKPQDSQKPGSVLGSDELQQPSWAHARPDFETITKALARRGADVNLANMEGRTPLHTVMKRSFISSKGNAGQLLATLVEAGADLNRPDDKGRTPLFQMLIDQSGEEAEQACRILVKAGAKINVVDSEGRPLIFESLRSPDLLRCLVELGGDPLAVDKGGNGLWHDAALRQHRVNGLPSALRSLGLSPESRNAVGQTPLHYASWVTLSNERGPIVSKRPLHDLFTESVDIDAADDDGITPLHVAIIGNENVVKQLLTAGANATKISNDGVTCLQIAAALIKGNALLMLLRNIRARRGLDFVVDFVNKRNALGRTALYYACASGRLETVQTLINAGAIVKVEDFDGSCWHGCNMFKGPEHTTSSTAEATRSEWTFSTWGLRAENLRTQAYPAAQDSLRLDDILSLLWSHDVGGPHLWEAMERAGERGDGYVLECLLLFDVWGWTLTEKMSQAIQDRKSYVAIMEKQCCDKHDRTLHDLIRKKNHIGLKRWAGERDLSTLDYTNREQRIFHKLVEDGNWTLLKEITLLAPEIVAQVELNIHRNKPTREHKSLLASACEKTMPDMGTVCFLVVSLRTGFEALGQTEEMSHSMTAAVRTCISGGYWWQLYEALPFLIEQGANINALDETGRTGLFGNFSRYARDDLEGLKHLLELAYDPSIPDRNSLNTPGFTLLSNCGNNVDLVKLLMAHGARVTQFDLRVALQEATPTRLKAMLANGADPNTRWQHPEMDEYQDNIRRHEQINGEGEGHVSINDMFPLHYAATECYRGGEAISILLEHGANLRLRYDNQSMMHAVLRSGKCPEQLLAFKGLNLEDQDYDGATLLLIACRKASDDAVFKLLDLGADVHARDHFGRNALHHCQGRLAVTRRLASLGPELINQHDDQGWTPFHLALSGNDKADSLGPRTPAKDDVALSLLELGADAHIKNKQKESALHMLFGSSWVLPEGKSLLDEDRQKLLDHLLATGLDVNAVDANGQTPIFYFFGAQPPKAQRSRQMPSSEARDLQLLSLLGNLGIDHEAVANDGRTLLHIVAETKGNRRLSRFKYLLGQGLHPRCEDASQETPLDVSARVGADDILDWYQAEGFKGESDSSEWILV